MADEETPTTAPTDQVDVTNAPSLPGLELPEYHGRRAVGMKTSVNGAGNRISRSHEIGERVVLVLETKVRKAGHEETDDGLVYAETLKVVDLFEVQGEPGKRLLSTVRQAYREADDERLGRTPLPLEDGVEVTTAADGTVLTPAELAELRGDPAAALTDERLSPVVVVYSDGARELWPDDFETGAARPKAGDRFELEGEEGPAAYVYAKEILHAETGERLEVWTDEQENDRLLELERSEEEKERAATVTERARTEVRPRPDDERVEILDDLTDPDVILDDLPEEPEFHDGNPEDFDPPLPDEPEGFDAGLEPLEPKEELADVVEGNFPAEPTPDDYAFVDRQIDELPDLLEQVSDLDEARRILEAEKRGRGRNLKTRKGAVDLILRRIAELEASTDGA